LKIYFSYKIQITFLKVIELLFQITLAAKAKTHFSEVIEIQIALYWSDHFAGCSR